MSEELYDAGVYAIVSRKTGAMYVGCSLFLGSRLATHVQGILNGRHTSKHIRSGFKDHGEQDIELRILERVAVPIPTDREPWQVTYYNLPGRTGLYACERKWIRQLQPSLNKNKFRPTVGIDIPVSEPALQKAST